MHGRVKVLDVIGSAWARKGETKHGVNSPLVYTNTKDVKAGPYGEKALSAAGGQAMAADLQRFIRRKEK